MEKIGEINVERIVALYREHHGFDASPYFPEGLKTLDICRCKDTGYDFYAPLALDGPPKFYEDLYASGAGDWGYVDEKWEHKFAAAQLRSGDRVLDIGCGAGRLSKWRARPALRRRDLKPAPMAAIRDWRKDSISAILGAGIRRRERRDV